MPSLSVLMLAHNGGRFLRPAVESVLGQSWRDLELILVDNASTDGAVEALHALARQDSRLRIVPQAINLGIPNGTQRALEAASGEFVVIADQDDLSHPTRLARQMDALRTQPHLGAVGCAAWTIDEAGHVIGREFALVRRDDFFRFSAFSTGVIFPAHCFRREVLERFPRRLGFRYSSDYDFVARANEAFAFDGLSEPLLSYRRHRQQATQAHRAEQIVSECAIRLLTARRRSGREERAEEVFAWLDAWRAARLTAAAGCRHFAEQALAEGLGLLAAYHARRWLGTAGMRSAVPGAVRIVWQAMRDTPGGAATIAHMFLRGPVRALGLQPWA